MNLAWIIAFASYVGATVGLCLLIVRAPRHCVPLWHAMRRPLVLALLICLGFALAAPLPFAWSRSLTVAPFPEAWPWPYAALSALSAIAGNVWLFAQVGFALTSEDATAPDSRS